MSKKMASSLVVFFLILASVQFASGLVLLWLKTGFTIEGVERFYRPDLFDVNAKAKSLYGLLKIALPHFFAMGLMWFVVIHFLMFAVKASQKVKNTLAMSTGLSMMSYNVLPFLITFHSTAWAPWTFLTFALFEIGLLLTVYICWKDAISDLSMSTQSARSGLLIRRPSFKIKT